MTSSRPSGSIFARTKPQRPKSMRQPRRCTRKRRRRRSLRLLKPAPRPALTLYIRIGQLIKGGKGLSPVFCLAHRRLPGRKTERARSASQPDFENWRCGIRVLIRDE
jgi:hypothetical protein